MIKGSSCFTDFNLDSVVGGVSLACLIFARGTRPVTRLGIIDFRQETGHKSASRGKEFKSERRRSGTSRPDDPLSRWITGSFSGDLRATLTARPPLSVPFASL